MRLKDDWWYIDEDGKRRDDKAWFFGRIIEKE